MLRTKIVMAVLLLGTPVPAAAHEASGHYGECGFEAVSQQDVTGPDRWTGAVRGHVAVYSLDHGNPVAATVTCDLRVDGVSQDTVTGSGVGVVPVAGRVDYVATDVQIVDICTIVDFTSDDTPTLDFCREPYTGQFPPQWVIDALNYVFDLAVNPVVVGVVDPLACAAIAALPPGVEPLSVVDGDLYVGQDLVYDCPPYTWTPNPPPPPPDVDPPVPTGAGWNDGTTGSLALATTGDAAAVAATCSFRLDPATGDLTVTGAAFGGPADSTTIRCLLRDAASGAPVYDESVTATGVAALSGRRTVGATALDVCAEGTAAVGTGLHCRWGRPA